MKLINHSCYWLSLEIHIKLFFTYKVSNMTWIFTKLITICIIYPSFTNGIYPYFHNNMWVTKFSWFYSIYDRSIQNKFFFDVTHGRFCNLLRSVGRVLYSFEKRRWALCHKNDKSLRHLICWKRARVNGYC